MERSFLKQCIDVEVDHWAQKSGKISLLQKTRFRYFQPESNAVYLIRKKLYYYSQGGKLGKIRARFLEVRLMRRYGIMVGDTCEIGLGFKIWHPSTIIINNATIGEGFHIQHNCTIGNKDRGPDGRGIGYKENLPVIGNNVCMYAGSYILGRVQIADDVIIGANTVVIHDALEPGTYVGSPARRVK